MYAQDKEVFFDKFCPTCEFYTAVDKDGFPVEQCEDCLAMPMNTDSHKPVNYKEVSK